MNEMPNLITIISYSIVYFGIGCEDIIMIIQKLHSLRGDPSSCMVECSVGNDPVHLQNKVRKITSSL